VTDPAHADAEGPTTVQRRGRVVAPLLLDGLAPEVPFGLVGRLVGPGSDTELRLQLHRIPRPQALDLVHRAEAVAETELASGAGPGATPSELESEVASARELGRQVADRDQDLYRIGIVLAATGTTLRRAERGRSDLVRRLQAHGFRIRRPLYEAATALAAPTFDGAERRPAGYWHTLHTDGAAAFFPFVDEGVAEPGGILVGVLLDDAAPVFVDRWAHGSHSWAFFGATGAGKSFLAALTALRTRWRRPDVDLVFLDPLGEFGRLATALGGAVVDPTAPATGRLNPLDPASTGGDRVEKAARVATFLRALFPTVRDEEAAALDLALESLYAVDREPTFADLVAATAPRPSSERLAVLLDLFVHGSLRHLNGPTTVRWGSGPTAVDLARVAEEHRPFHLAYLLDAVLGRLRDRPGPKLVIVDEAHLLARDPATAAFLDRLVRHARHFGAGLLLLSQNPDDFLGTESGRSLLRNLRATIFLRTPEVSAATRAFFHLTDSEADWLPRARLPREAGYSEALLRLGPSHLPIACVASTPEYEFLRTTMRPVDPGHAG